MSDESVASVSNTYPSFKPLSFELNQVIYTGPNSTVYRAYSRTLEKKVIVKTNNYPDQTPSQRQRNKYSKEYNVGQFLNGNESLDEGHIVEYFSLEKYKKSTALIMEDFDGESLDQVLEQNATGLDVLTFLRLAYKITECVTILHTHHIIHQALCPQHILWNRQTNDVKLIDMGLSSELTQGFQISLNFKHIGKQLHYISPEQTGRSNCGVDFRSDLYALGVTFYRLITGELPFISQTTNGEIDPLDIIYDTIAKAPVDPTTKRSHIPNQVSSLILKLLAKAPGDRYQSTFGLKYDLKTLYDLISTSEKDLSTFQIGSHDVRSTFCVSSKLYGREEEVKTILNTFDDVARGKCRTAVILVSGFSGIGKTSLVNEVHRPLTLRKGYFISGKFDQFKRNIPFWPFIQAFRQLILQLLTEPDNKIKKWRSDLLGKLGSNAQLIIDVIPEVQHITGVQQAVPEVGPLESANRFKLLFQTFVTVFAKKTHPLVIFLDDLQWADLPTLQLIELLSCSTTCKYLMIVGAFRDNEVDELHPLVNTVREIRKKTIVQDINLSPLGINEIKLLIIDTFDLPKAESNFDLVKDVIDVEELETSESDLDPNILSKLIFNKTHGNPFFVVMFLTDLHRQGLICFNLVLGTWQWYINKINSANISDNVVQMMTSRITKLSENTQKVLSLAASIGSRFDFTLLSLVYGTDKNKCAKALWPAIKDGLIVQLGGSPLEDVWLNEQELIDDRSNSNNTMQFLHDRVHQAAYELVTSEERNQVHLNIGRVMLKSLTEKQLDDSLFDIVTHFKNAKNLIKDSNERHQLAKLALQAGKRSRLSAAYSSCLDFLQFGIEMLSIFEEDMWNNDLYYRTSIEIYIMLCEVEFLLGNYEKSDKLYPFLISKCKNDLDKVDVYYVQVLQFEIQQNYEKCVSTNINCLKLLGIDIPNITEIENVKNRMKLEIEKIPINLQGRNINDLVNQKKIENPYDISIMRALTSSWAAAFCLGSADMTTLVSLITINQSLIKGNCEYTAAGFSCYGYSAGQLTGDYESAYEFARVGLQISLLSGENNRSTSKCFFGFYTGPHHYCEPIISSIKHLKHGFDLSIQLGDYAFATYLAHHIVTDLFFSGTDDLVEVYKLHQKFLTFLKRTNKFIYNFAISCTRPIRLLWTPRAGSWAIQSMIDHHDVDNEEWYKENSQIFLQRIGFYYSAILEAYYFEDRKNWIRIADEGWENINFLLLGSAKITEITFCSGMIYLENTYDDNFDPILKKRCLERADECIEKFKIWAKLCPYNYLHKLNLLLGQKSLIQGNRDPSIQYFEQALEFSRNNKNKQYEAISHEVMGKAWLTFGNTSSFLTQYARMHFEEAVSIYEEWGANGKVDWLRKRYNTILSPSHKSRIPMIVQINNEILNVQHGNSRIWSSTTNSSTTESRSGGGSSTSSVTNNGYDSESELGSSDDIDHPSITSTPSFNQPFTNHQQSYNNSYLNPLHNNNNHHHHHHNHSTHSITSSSSSSTTLNNNSIHNINTSSIPIKKKNNSIENTSSIDLLTFMKMDQLAESEQTLVGFLNHMMKIILQNTGATKGVFVQADSEQVLTVVAECKSDTLENDVLRAELLDTYENIPSSLVYYVARKLEIVIINDASLNSSQQQTLQSQSSHHNLLLLSSLQKSSSLSSSLSSSQQSSTHSSSSHSSQQQQQTIPNDYNNNNNNIIDFIDDKYLNTNNIKSILCIPIVKLKELKGVLYLENNLITNAFSNQRIKIITTLANHLASSLNEARFEQVLQSEKQLKIVATELGIVKKRLEEFIDVLCHELRNPLNAIFGNKDIISEHLEIIRENNKSEFIKEHVQECIESIEAMTISSYHLKDIVDTVLTVSMLEDQSNRLQIVPFVPCKVIDMIGLMFKALVADKGISLITEKQDGLQNVTVLGDLYRFKEVIINLVSNAIKFTEKNGKIIISMSKVVNNNNNQSSTSSINQQQSSSSINQSSSIVNNHNQQLIDGTTQKSNGNQSTLDNEMIELLFQVTDTGIGIKEEEIPRLFQKFGQANAQTYNKYGGSGLGLKISKEIVELMGGSQIQVTSKYGEGSTFYFSIPFKLKSSTLEPLQIKNDPNGLRTDSEVQSPGKHRVYDSFAKLEMHKLENSFNSPSTASSTSSSSNLSVSTDSRHDKLHESPLTPRKIDRKILVVEDNSINQKLLCRILQLAGYSHDIANNGAECVEKIRHNNYLLVLMDLEMPVMGGIEATKKIRLMEQERAISDKDKLVIIGVSANSRRGSIDYALEAGMQGYITKPYLKNDILNIIEKWTDIKK